MIDIGKKNIADVLWDNTMQMHSFLQM